MLRGATTGRMTHVLRGLHAPGLLLVPLACFGGDGTLGGACERDSDCGGEQSCQRQICSLCGDGVAQSGELCFEGPEASDAQPSGVGSLTLVDVDGDGTLELVWPEPDGLAVAALSGESFADAQVRPFDVRAVWSGDVDGDGQTELLTQDSSAAVTLWRPDAAGELLEVSELELEPLQGLNDAVIHPDFGIVGQTGNTLVRVGLEREPASAVLEGNITHLRAAPSLNDGASFDVLAVTDAPAFVPVFATEDGLTAQPPVALAEAVLDIATTTWNGDALGDAVVLYETGEVQVWLGTGGGGFVEGPSGASVSTSERLAVFDANSDRLLDVVTYGPSSSVDLLVRRGAELDDGVELDGAALWWIAPLGVDADRFVDLVLYDGARISVLRSAP